MSALYIIRIIVLIIKIVVPIVLIISLLLTLMKGIIDSSYDDLEKIKSEGVRKIIAALVIFLVPTFVNIIVKYSSNDFEFSACISGATKENIDIKQSAEDALKYLSSNNSNNIYSNRSSNLPVTGGPSTNGGSRIIESNYDEVVDDNGILFTFNIIIMFRLF